MELAEGEKEVGSRAFHKFLEQAAVHLSIDFVLVYKLFSSGNGSLVQNNAQSLCHHIFIFIHIRALHRHPFTP